MNVVYVTVRFPGPTETFAGLEVLTLERAGVGVRVLAMRSPLRDHDRMIRERGLGAVPVEAATATTTLRGVAEAIRHPAAALQLLVFAIRHTWRRPVHLAAAVALSPSALWCYARIRATSPDVVHLFWGHFPSLVGHLVARRCPGVVLSHFLGAYDLEYGFGASAPVARSADVVWTHARANVARIEALGVHAERIRVVHRGVDVGAANRAAAAKTPRRVVAVGRLIPPKAFDDALRVFARVHDVFPDATLVVVGDGPERARLERLARDLGVGDAVTFTGQIPQRDLFAHFAAAEVFLLMTRDTSDRLPNAAKEAALHGCVAVTTRSTGIEELFTDGDDAVLVPYGDVGSAAARAVDLFGDPSAMARMARAARARVRAAFDVNDSIACYVEAWRAAAGSMLDCARHTTSGD